MDVKARAQRLRLAPADHALLRRALSQLPRESAHPRYPAAQYPDTYAKFLLGGGGTAPLPPGEGAVMWWASQVLAAPRTSP